ncbi:MAG: transcriptional regulator BetI [Salaquimonas sp.]
MLFKLTFIILEFNICLEKHETMPRIGAEPERRKALIHAAIEMIGEQGSLDVSVKDIAKQAGMSSALAFHYFGGKDEIIIETMRHLLRAFSTSAVESMAEANSPGDRVDAIIVTSFSPEQFDRKTIAAWLVFYLKAYSSDEAARLLNVYTRRLNSNLVFNLTAIVDRSDALQIADGLGALIDGLYIRQALSQTGSNAEGAINACRNFITQSIQFRSKPTGVH